MNKIIATFFFLVSACVVFAQVETGIFVHKDTNGNIVFVGTDENNRAGKVPAVMWDGTDILVNGDPIGGTQIWQEVGDGRIYYNTDNVGIGTDDPDFQLTTTQDIKIHNIRIGQGAQAAGLGLGVFGNTFVGEATGETITTGYLNTAVGWQTGDAITTGNTNTLFGSSAGQELNTGSSNTFVGQSAGGFVTSGRGNTVIGYASSPSADSDNNVIIGDSNVGIEGNENIIIGNNIALFGSPQNEYLQIADIIYGKDIESPSTDVSGGSIGINVTDPLFNFHTVGTVGFTNLTESAAAKMLYLNPTTFEVSFSDAPAQPDLSAYDNHIANDNDLSSNNELQSFTHNGNTSTLSQGGGTLSFNSGTDIDVVANGNGGYAFNFTGDVGGENETQIFDVITGEKKIRLADLSDDQERGLIEFENGQNTAITVEKVNASTAKIKVHALIPDAETVWSENGNGAYYYGAVGIGTTNPQTLLEIRGSSDSGLPAVRLNEGFPANNSYLELVDYSINDAGLFKLSNTGVATLAFDAAPDDAVSDANILFFQGTNTTGAVGIDIYDASSSIAVNTRLGGNGDSFFNVSTGNVGIGTSNPTGKLHVAGQTIIEGSDAAQPLKITNNGSFAQIQKGNNLGSQYIQIFEEGAAAAFIGLVAGAGELMKWQNKAIYTSGNASNPVTPSSTQGAFYYNNSTEEYRFYDHASDSWNPVALNPVEEGGRIQKGFWTNDIETGNIINNNGGRVEINNGLFVGRGGLTLDDIEELETPFTLQYDTISKQVSYYHAWSVDKSGSSALTLAPATNVLKLTESILESNLGLDDLKTLTGVAGGSADLGVFLGSTIPENTTIKDALQRIVFALELLADKSVVIEGGPFKGDLEAFQNGIRNNQWYELSDDNDYGAPKNTPRRLKLF